MKFLSLRENTRGFTLIELIIAVSIVAVLASVVIVNLQDGKKKARDTQRLNDIEQIQLALRLYKDANGEYPTGFDKAEIGVGGLIDTALAPYLSIVPADPRSSTTEYKYVYDSDHPCRSGNHNVVIYATTMETESFKNQWKGKDTVCGTGGSGISSETFGVVLK